MTILELPKTTEEINILGKIYKLDITDFNILGAIQELPSLNISGVPTSEQMELYIGQYQNIFSNALGEKLSIEHPPQMKYFFLRSLIIKLHDLIIKKQSEYLELNYTEKMDYDKILSITNNLAKIKEGEGNE